MPIDFKIKARQRKNKVSPSPHRCSLRASDSNNCFFVSHCLSLSSTWSGFWMCAHTIPPCCAYWFCWLPTNNFWSTASSEQTDALRLPDECNNKRVNASSLHRAKNQPFHISHSGIHWQAEACLHWHTSVFLLSFSVQTLFISSSAYLNSICVALDPQKPHETNMKPTIMSTADTLCNLFPFLQQWPSFLQRDLFFFPPLSWVLGSGCGDINVRVSQCGAQQDSQLACSPISTHEICCRALFKFHLRAGGMQKCKACCKHFKKPQHVWCMQSDKHNRKPKGKKKCRVLNLSSYRIVINSQKLFCFVHNCL